MSFYPAEGDWASLAEALRAHSVDNETTDFQYLQYGQAAALNRELPAAELVRTLVDEAQGILGST